MPADLSPRSRQLLAEANEILAMAKDLQARGLDAEAVAFALAANERLCGVRALESMREAADAR